MQEMPTSGTGAPHRGALILVLGILSIVLCPLLGPAAGIMGKGDLAKIDQGQMDREGKGLTQAGMICGIVGSVFLVFWLIWVAFVLFIGVGAAAAGAAGSGP